MTRFWIWFYALATLIASFIVGSTLIQQASNHQAVETAVLVFTSVVVARLVYVWLRYASQLQEQVMQRTQELGIANQQLVAHIAELERAEAALRESEQKFRTIFEESTDGMILIDEQGRIEEWNRAEAQMTGLTREEVVGQLVVDIQRRLLPRERDTLERYARMQAALVQVLTTGQADWLAQVGNAEIYRADGSVFATQERYFPIQTDTGFRLGLIVRDVTAQKRAAAALAESEARFRAVWETATDGMVLSDAEGTVVMANPAYCQIYGYTAEEVVGHSCTVIYPEAQRAEALAHYQGMFHDAQAVRRFETRMLRADGVERFVEAHISFLLQDGQRVAMLSIVRDITERMEMEQALRASEARYRTLVEQMPAIIYICSVGKGRGVLYVSPAVERLVGYKPADYVADPYLWRKQTHPDDMSQVIAQVQQSVANHTPFVAEYRVFTKDGRIKWFRDTGVVVQDMPGSTPVFQGVALDITEHMQAEEAYYTLVEHSLQGLKILQNGLIVFANPAAARITGYTVEELQALGPEGVDATLHPDDRAQVQDYYAARLRGDATPLQYIYRIVRKDGTVCWIENYAVRIEYRGEPAVQATFIDITERKQMETRLQASALRHRRLVEQLPAIVYSCLPDMITTVLFICPHVHQFLGYTADEFLADPHLWANLLHPEDRDRVLAQVAYALMTHMPLVMEYRIFSKDGSMKWFHDEAVLVHDPVDNALVFQGVALDITERKQAEAALQQANNELSQRVRELEQRTGELAALGELGETLHLCATFEEAYGVVQQFMPQLFPQDAGILGVLQAERELVEVVLTWGTPGPDSQSFTPRDCWGLRRGRLHVVDSPNEGMYCQHIHDPMPAGYVCVPMVALGEILGLLSVQFAAASAEQDGEHYRRQVEAKQRLATALAEQIALALSNLRLRERLLQQVVRDPLTELFNRRYLDEVLERELRRAKRHQTILGIIMLDLDHFRNFNNTFGHPAGDMLLWELARFLQRNTRAEDIVCRYGGEEFTILLPDASLEDTMRRAEQLRVGAEQLQVRHHDHLLGSITLSLGVAGFPQHGATAAELLAAADAALYRAKAEGRNRVMMSSTGA